MAQKRLGENKGKKLWRMKIYRIFIDPDTP
jgi:hypothetical protein